MALAKKVNICFWAILLIMSSCSEDDIENIATPDPGYASAAYFIDANLVLADSLGSIIPIEFYADLDPQTPEGKNEFLNVVTGGVREVYSVFFSDSTQLDTNLQEQILLDNFSILYGSASYEGVGFCFYLTQPDQSSSFEQRLEDILAPGRVLQLGQQPGMVEIGYYKNHPDAINRVDRGLISTTGESSSGYMEIQDVTTVQGGPDIEGFQVTVEFNAPLQQQLGIGQGGILTGQARIFVPGS